MKYIKFLGKVISKGGRAYVKRFPTSIFTAAVIFKKTIVVRQSIDRSVARSVALFNIVSQ